MAYTNLSGISYEGTLFGSNCTSSRSFFNCTCHFFSIGVEKLLDIVPDNSSVDLTSKNTVFTLFIPADVAFSFLTLDDIFYINDNITYTERVEVNILSLQIGGTCFECRI